MIDRSCCILFILEDLYQGNLGITDEVTLIAHSINLIGNSEIN